MVKRGNEELVPVGFARGPCGLGVIMLSSWVAERRHTLGVWLKDDEFCYVFGVLIWGAPGERERDVG